MQKIFLISAVSLFVGCSQVRNSETIVKANPDVTPLPEVTATQRQPSLKPVSLKLKLNAKQKKYLNESLPADVRNILENSETFEILAEQNLDEGSESDIREFNPNYIGTITTEQLKKEILEAFYLDAAFEDSPAVCYEPHHSIRAAYQGKTIEVEICFECSRFVVKGSSKDAWGTIVRENRRSEKLLSRIIQEIGTELKK